MKRGSNLFALLLVLLTGARLATTHAPTAASARPVSEAAHARELVPREVTPEDIKCEAFAALPSPPEEQETGQITSLVERYIDGRSYSGAMAESSLPASIRYMIVTVPDPLHTHLSVQFDRTIEALQQGMQDEKYTYDSSWLPWKKQSADYGSLADQERAEKETTQREKCPGLVLFRSNMIPSALERKPYEQGMFVFVVGETPTSGLNQSQWRNALAWIDKYSTRQRTDKALRILGPTFSGSMPSFARSLDQIRPETSSFGSVLLYSGRIRGCGSWMWLKKQLNSSAKNLPVRVADFNENDAIQIDRFYKFVNDRGHALSEVAVLSEDETAYGGLPDAPSTVPSPQCEPTYPPENRPLHLYYPRDISAIRSAYQEQSIFASGASAENVNSSHMVLQPQSEAPQHNQTDTIEPFSGQGMALTQEAQLYGIVNSLRSHGIRYLILRSTNSLDYLFLARFFHRAYPDAYIVTMGTDLLFGREIDSTEFRGVMALSVLPLLPRGQDWTKQATGLKQHAHRVFGSDIMEGVYLAGRFLISDPPVTKQEDRESLEHYVHPAKPDLPDYAEPFWEDHSQPQVNAATWLSVIGREGYWPLAVLRKPFEQAPESNLTSVKRSESSTAGKQFTGQFSMSSAWKFCCLLAVIAICLHFVACQFSCRRQGIGAFVQFTPLPGKRQLALLALGWSIVCSLLLLLWLASVPLYAWLRPMDKVWVWLIAVFTLGGIAATLLDLGRWPWPSGNAEGGELSCVKIDSRLWNVLSLSIIAAAAVAALYIFDYFKPDGVITAFRLVHFTSGISPIVSILFMLGGLYWWFWQSLCGLALLGDGRPVLPDCRNIKILARVSSTMAKNIEQFARPFPDVREVGKLLYIVPLLLLMLEACVLQRPWSEGFDSVFHSLESRPLSWTLHLLFALCLYLLMLECIQLLATWFALKRLLLALDRLPLRRTFAALQGLSMRSLWTLSGTTSRSRYAIFSHQLESLNHLRNELDYFGSRDWGSAEVRKLIERTFDIGLRFVEERSEGADLAMVNTDGALALRKDFSVCTESIISNLLLPSWKSERSTLNLSEGDAEEKAKTRYPLSDEAVVKLAE